MKYFNQTAMMTKEKLSKKNRKVDGVKTSKHPGFTISNDARDTI